VAGYSRVTSTVSTGVSSATRAAMPSMSCRASGTSSGTAATARTSASPTTEMPRTWTCLVESTEEKPTSQTAVPARTSTSRPITTNGQRRRRRR
jgi:hypothetical protein